MNYKINCKQIEEAKSARMPWGQGKQGDWGRFFWGQGGRMGRQNSMFSQLPPAPITIAIAISIERIVEKIVALLDLLRGSIIALGRAPLPSENAQTVFSTATRTTPESGYIDSIPQVRSPGFQFGGGLHQRKKGIANRTVTGKNLLGREKTLRRNKWGRTYADESMPPSKKG